MPALILACVDYLPISLNPRSNYLAPINRNQWPQWIGMAGPVKSESLAALFRNAWPRCSGLRTYSQKEAAKMLGVKQPEISAIMSAKISRFSQERLIDFLTKLEQTVTIEVRSHRQGEPYKQVTLAP